MYLSTYFIKREKKHTNIVLHYKGAGGRLGELTGLTLRATNKKTQASCCTWHNKQPKAYLSALGFFEDRVLHISY
jgi:hypothetical protein